MTAEPGKEQIKLEQLAPYLPYGLRGLFELKSIIPHIAEKANETREKILDADSVTFFIKYCKPLLIPITELTHSINQIESPLTTISHEYFGYGKGYVSEPEFKKINENGFIGLQSNNQGLYFVREETNYGISTWFCSALKVNDIWIHQKVTMQLEMFNYLFSKHFDVFGLIPKGLAVNKMEIDNIPH